MPVSADTSIEFSHKGDIRPRALDSARDKVTRVAEHAREPVRRMEIRLTLEPNPARELPAIAEATLDVDGRVVRAHVAASTLDEAVDTLADRLKRRLDRHEQRRHRLHDRRRTGDSGPGEWRHGDLPAANPEFIDLPFDEREVRRQKTFAMEPISVEEALFDLTQLGHEFYLFVDDASRTDALVHYAANGTFEVLFSDTNGSGDIAVPDGVVVRPGAAPQLTLADAKEHLEASGDRHLFFRTGEPLVGQVLYRRYDGHYGLVTGS